MLNKYNDTEIDQRRKIHQMQTNAVLQTQNEIDNLTSMRYRELIDDKEYMKEKKEIQKRLDKLKEELGDTEQRAENWLELTEQTFNLITYAAYHFNEGSFEQKRTVLSGFGSNFLLKDKKLQMEAHRWLIPIENEYKNLETEYLSFEPDKTKSESDKNASLEQIRLSWLGMRDSNPRWRDQNPLPYHLANPQH